MATGLMLKKLTLKNLLSFGPEGVELELGPLNVLIGPNASGKSNLLDAIRLLAACPKDVTEPLIKSGGFDSWSYKGTSKSSNLFVGALVDNRLVDPDEYDPFTESPLSHRIVISKIYDNRIGIWEEEVTTEVGSSSSRTYDRDGDGNNEENTERGKRPDKRQRELGFSESMLSPAVSDRFPLSELTDFYNDVLLYSEWNTSRNSQMRQPQPADADGTRLNAEGTNLTLVLSVLDNRPLISRRIVSELIKLLPRAQSIKTPVIFGQVGGYLEEEGLSENIPFARLSDGTLRWLCLITVLLHPDPPSLICLEEPEVGLHPDMIPHLAQLLVEASERSQLIVTTHSDLLVSALSNRPESIVVCEHNGSSTEFRRLDTEPLQKYIADYRLGEAWLEGRLGGTRY